MVEMYIIKRLEEKTRHNETKRQQAVDSDNMRRAESPTISVMGVHIRADKARSQKTAKLQRPDHDLSPSISTCQHKKLIYVPVDLLDGINT